MKWLLILLPLLLSPGVQAVETFNYEAGYRYCIRDFFRDISRQKWNEMSDRAKSNFRADAHKHCR